MTTPADRTDQRTRLPFHREARAALSGRVPVLLAVATALLSGGLLGYSWRMCTAEVPSQSIVVEYRASSAPLFYLPWLHGQTKSKPALILLGDKPPCPGAEPAAAKASEAAAAKAPELAAPPSSESAPSMPAR